MVIHTSERWTIELAVAHIVAHDTGADLVRTQLEPFTELADLAVV